MEYTRVKPKKLAKYGKIVNKVLYLKPGVHTMSLDANELDRKVIKALSNNIFEEITNK